jgi:hypothetical protein
VKVTAQAQIQKPAVATPMILFLKEKKKRNDESKRRLAERKGETREMNRSEPVLSGSELGSNDPGETSPSQVEDKDEDDDHGGDRGVDGLGGVLDASEASGDEHEHEHHEGGADEKRSSSISVDDEEGAENTDDLND